jgi:hypothetical protein
VLGTRPTKLAEDRAEQLKRDPDKVATELDARLRADLKRNGDFSRIHALPRSGLSNNSFHSETLA